MAERAPCKWLKPTNYGGNTVPACKHPVVVHLCGCRAYPHCHGCPCHEPEPAKDTQRTDPPKTCRWHQDEFKNWFSECSGVMPTVTPWDGKAIHGMFCPECGKRITTQVHDKP